MHIGVSGVPARSELGARSFPCAHVVLPGPDGEIPTSPCGTLSAVSHGDSGDALSAGGSAFTMPGHATWTQQARHVAGEGGVQLRSSLTGDGVMSSLAVVAVGVAPILLIVRMVSHGGVYSNRGDMAANELAVQNAIHLHQSVGPY